MSTSCNLKPGSSHWGRGSDQSINQLEHENILVYFSTFIYINQSLQILQAEKKRNIIIEAQAKGSKATNQQPPQLNPHRKKKRNQQKPSSSFRINMQQNKGNGKKDKLIQTYLEAKVEKEKEEREPL